MSKTIEHCLGYIGEINMNWIFKQISQDIFNQNTLLEILNHCSWDRDIIVLDFKEGVYVISGKQDPIQNSLFLPMNNGSIVFSGGSICFLVTSNHLHFYSDIACGVLPLFFKKISSSLYSWTFDSNDILVNNIKIGSIAKWKIDNNYCTGVFINFRNETELIKKYCTKPSTKSSIGFKELNLSRQYVINCFQEAWNEFFNNIA